MQGIHQLLAVISYCHFITAGYKLFLKKFSSIDYKQTLFPCFFNINFLIKIAKVSTYLRLVIVSMNTQAFISFS